MRRQRIIVGLSGGVDSAVAALRLIEQGHRVEGLFMKNWEDDDEGYCAAADDLAEAKRVAETLEIPLHKANFAREYWDRVFAYFLAEYRAGRTPNPDVLCNKEIKFKAFLDYARSLGADAIATGHYARIDAQANLLRGLDPNKDQSYFLHALTRAQLAASRFPLGDSLKSDIRRIAREAGLPNHQRKDSTGICFIGERRFRDFLARYLPATPGTIVNPQGESLGTHQGLMYYTLGQRQGLGIGGTADGGEAPWYVAEKRLAHNELLVVQGHDHPLLQSTALWARPLHWISGMTPGDRFECTVKTRYRQIDQACTVTLAEDRAHVTFERPQRAVTPGQFAVFYRGDICLGGGVIETIEPWRQEGQFTATTTTFSAAH
ncbi:tRNA 2-thiouridine(34) synthase MnmA [Acidihalobacter yilgarnensis]|uniref:tRNA-specific 2-thiouridylase MnmA n=1 Tax=Acidihalobacter yilgarnensis TaxID=2819280 RepID=A0A1D8ITD2_9GAMM|nr:tRNA 2-thiouridine(34) synthase MnmA [Acidihalobacter yilgarnensis]AOU99647.1 tRNA 2-thiouridine(34) synthase MnmA [Acidihalobacter yilgarnensis]